MEERDPGSSPAENSEDVPTDVATGEAPDGGWAFAAQAHYDPTEPRDLTTVVIKAIGEAEGVPITEITSPTLYDVVDVAGIESALFGRPEVSNRGTDSAVEFRYKRYKVRVATDGWVTVLRQSDGPTADQE